MARLLIEIGKYDEAIAMLTRIPAASPAAKDAAAALEKARALQAGRSGPTPTPMPPKVTK